MGTDQESRSERSRRPALVDRVARLWSRLRAFNAAQTELQERLWLLYRPWEEELLHWGADGRLHGSIQPPSRNRRRSVTGSGWCPGLRDRSWANEDSRSASW